MIRHKSLLWMLLVSFCSALFVSVSTVIYTGVNQAKNNEKIQQQQIENNRQWCELLTTLDNAYSTLPPQSELGKKIATSIHKLRKDFEC